MTILVNSMSWCNYNNLIPYENNALIDVIDFFVFHCPASVRSRVKNGTCPNGNEKKVIVYKDVSARGCSFHRRGISGSLLLTVLAEIRKPVVKNGLYQIVKTDVDVSDTVSSLIKNKAGNDPMPDLIVFHTRTDMPDSEAVFYYIRNALAHGSFEIIKDIHEKAIYKFECKKDNIIKAQMQLKENTLLRIKKIASMRPQDIRTIQRKRK